MSEKDVIDRAETLSFPQSVLEYFQGYLGQPPYGFPEPLRTRILSSKRLEPIEGRPGKSLTPMDFAEKRADLEETFGSGTISELDVLSYAMYPKVKAHL